MLEKLLTIAFILGVLLYDRQQTRSNSWRQSDHNPTDDYKATSDSIQGYLENDFPPVQIRFTEKATIKVKPSFSFLWKRVLGRTTHAERIEERMRRGLPIKVKDFAPYYQYPTEFPIENGVVRQCLRCLGPIPSEEHAGQYRGAASRTDRSVFVEICSKCGVLEADEDFDGVLMPQSDWPKPKERA